MYEIGVIKFIVKERESLDFDVNERILTIVLHIVITAFPI